MQNLNFTLFFGLNNFLTCQMLKKSNIWTIDYVME